MTVLQALLIAIFYYIGTGPVPFGSMGNWATINRPLVMGWIVGLILGDPVKGTIIGATINIIYLGFISAGGTLPSDSGMAGTFGTAFALVGGLDANAAMALAIPMGALGSLLWVVTMTYQSFFVRIADRWIEEGRDDLMIWIDYFIPHGIKAVARIAYSFVGLYYGSSVITSLVDRLQGPVLDALSVMGGVLPAVGIAMMMTMIFNGKAKVFFFLGFLATSFLGLGTIPTMLIFLCVGFLVVGFDQEDFLAFKNVQTNETAFEVISKKDLIHGWVLWELFCESLYNYERMQGIGFVTAMVPILRKTTKGDKQKMIDGLKLHSMFFNTDHDFGGAIYGVCAAMEEQKALGQDIPDEAFISLKAGLMGPCAGIGDTLSQVLLLPALSVIFINLALNGATWAPLAYTIIFIAIFYGVGYIYLMVGYKSGGEAIIRLIGSNLFHKAIELANIVGCGVAGAMINNFVSFNWNVAMYENEMPVFDLQTDVFDALVPGLMPLAITLGIYYAIKKGKKVSVIMIFLMVVSFVLGILRLVR
ncbi:MAG: PTS system mannose/fructose/sorbose family transporter subunit IID [Erysipelotrichaceae bacterium]|nr:PTS system mannose/fructose/sorbose family transporter subunit IID [Erysipelotrichaceae bacterium]